MSPCQSGVLLRYGLVFCHRAHTLDVRQLGDDALDHGVAFGLVSQCLELSFQTLYEVALTQDRGGFWAVVFAQGFGDGMQALQPARCHYECRLIPAIFFLQLLFDLLLEFKHGLPYLLPFIRPSEVADALALTDEFLGNPERTAEYDQGIGGFI